MKHLDEETELPTPLELFIQQTLLGYNTAPRLSCKVPRELHLVGIDDHIQCLSLESTTTYKTTATTSTARDKHLAKQFAAWHAAARAGIRTLQWTARLVTYLIRTVVARQRMNKCLDDAKPRRERRLARGAEDASI